MEDDDEFEDLYTNMLRPFASSSPLSSASEPHQSLLVPPSLHRPINLNLKSSNDDDGIIFKAPHSNSTAPNQTLAPQPKESVCEVIKLDLALARSHFFFFNFWVCVLDLAPVSGLMM